MSDVSNSFSAWETLPEDEPPLYIAHSHLHATMRRYTVVEKSFLKYHISDGKVDYFSVPKSGVSLQEMDNGVHLSMNDVEFHASLKAELEVGVKPFEKWSVTAKTRGNVEAVSENANIDVKLKWSNFKFIPTVSMNSNVRVVFAENVEVLKFLSGKIEKMIASKVNSKVPKKIADAIRRQVNPSLKQFKQQLVSMGYKKYHVDWTVHNNTLRVALTPKSGKAVVSPVTPIDNMLCLNASIVSMSSTNKSRVKKAAVTNGFDIICVAPKYRCEENSCSACTDIDIIPVMANSTDRLNSCLPAI
ncbi:hypothetical protein RB195_019773 [Necator americanus]|uniref:LBP / BPI / CETP family protein n=1 Tax=Necator americanus TaxID=51031 RepID=A0ABR1CGH2_NECAM